MAVRIAVREIHVENIPVGLAGLDGYSQALIIWRCRGSVVGKSMLAVHDGEIRAEVLQNALTPRIVWFIWVRLLEELPAAPSLTASVAVCTRDRTRDLADCLPGLRKLAGSGHDVLVIDSCPSDSATATLMKEYPEIRYVLEPRPGLGVARNTAIRVASSEIIAFTDDDAQVDDGWLDALLRNFRDPMTALVLGVTAPLELETPSQQWFEESNAFMRTLLRLEVDLRLRDPLHAGGLGAGVNMAFRRDAALMVGGFDDALGPGTLTMSGDDFDFYHRILAAGLRAVCEPGALVWHRHRTEWSNLRRTIWGYGVGVFSWLTRAVVEEREFGAFSLAGQRLFRHCIPNFARSALKRPGCLPRDLAWAELSGAFAGPRAYYRSRSAVRSAAHLDGHPKAAETL